MIAWAGRHGWRAVRTAISAVKKANDEQVYMWESMLRQSRAAPQTGARTDRAARPARSKRARDRWAQARARSARREIADGASLARTAAARAWRRPA